jgi:uncharacterized protein (DUF1778 family)
MKGYDRAAWTVKLRRIAVHFSVMGKEGRNMAPTTPQTNEQRNERLEARVTKKQKDLLRQAAALQGRSLSDFLVHAAAEAASRVVREQQILELTSQEQAAFVDALLHPPKPGPRLKAAARRYRKTLGA